MRVDRTIGRPDKCGEEICRGVRILKEALCPGDKLLRDELHDDSFSLLLYGVGLT